ncbi:MAG: DeoR/GlpR transcriptional regulator [Brevibacillus sp.]|nr:DeoR/GlpR transcriptional regulator [Brevibacillus sp.]
MYGEERKAKIVEYVTKQTRASVQELSLAFHVSESTIRRDLKELEEAKLLRRTHGGAVSLQSVTFEPTFGEKEEAYRREKEAIARKAASFIEEGDTILLDSGTTTMFLVKELKAFSRLTVVTNSLIFAHELQHHPGIDLILTGGTLRKETLALVGPIADQSFAMVRVDKAFIATNGLDLTDGLTTPNLVEAKTKKQMIRIAKEVILLTDHSKLGKVAFAKVADLEEIDKCIIDDGAPLSAIEELEKTGMDVFVVHPREE